MKSLLICIADWFSEISSRSKVFVVLLLFTIISFIIQLIFFPTSLPFSKGLSSPMDNWTSELGGFQIVYPASWATVEFPQGNHGDLEEIGSIHPRGGSPPYVFIARRIFPINSALDDVYAWGERRILERAGNNNLELFNGVTINETRMTREYQIGFDTLFGDVVHRCKDLYHFQLNLGYQLTFCADLGDWEYFEPVFNSMIVGFRLDENNINQPNNSLQPTPRTVRFAVDGSGLGILKSKPGYARGG